MILLGLCSEINSGNAHQGKWILRYANQWQLRVPKVKKPGSADPVRCTDIYCTLLAWSLRAHAIGNKIIIVSSMVSNVLPETRKEFHEIGSICILLMQKRHKKICLNFFICGAEIPPLHTWKTL